MPSTQASGSKGTPERALQATTDARSAKTTPAPSEASQLVTGYIEVDPTGAVASFTLDERDLLPDQALAFLDRSIPQWRFKPVLRDGQPVAARSDMSLRLVLAPTGDGQYALGVRGVAFGIRSAEAGTRVGIKKLSPPDYPGRAMVHGSTADVYLLVQVGRDGRVMNVVEEQVNLTSQDDGTVRPDELRAMFSEAAILKARRWRFTPPTTGDEADDLYWTLRVPVYFSVFHRTVPKPGRWVVYQPGPRRERPDWARDEDPGANFSPDA
jgi:hypothetical protein